MRLRQILSFAIPALVAGLSFAQVRAIGTLIDRVDAPEAIAPFADARRYGDDVEIAYLSANGVIVPDTVGSPRRAPARAGHW